MESVTEDTTKFMLPDHNDVSGLLSLMHQVDGSNDYGARTFANRIKRYLRSYDLCQRAWESMETSIATLNGVRNERKVSPETVARKYFKSLNARQLKEHCKVWGIDSTQYIWPDDMPQVVEELIKAQLATDSQD